MQTPVSWALVVALAAGLAIFGKTQDDRWLSVGSAKMFDYPSTDDRCLLVRIDDTTFVAYSQACTHLSCAVVPKVAEGVLHCPCHQGYFDLRTGRNIAGPPPRPLPKITLDVKDGEIFATGVEARTV